jgi:hypothetical protein
MKKTLFLILSGAIVIFSIICICSGPIINGVIPKSGSWKTENCQKLTDEYKAENDKDSKESKKKTKNKCNRNKAMYGLEYSSLIIDVICGFVCTILGLLHYFDIGKPFEKVTGIIGLATGIIGFVLTLVYVIYSGYIFTKDPYEDNNGNKIYKADGDWVYAKWEDGKGYKCKYYKEKNTNSIYAKYSDLGKKQYNYNKEKTNLANTVNLYTCSYEHLTLGTPSDYYPDKCGSDGYISQAIYPGCDNLYGKYYDSISHKYLFDRWITTIIFSCLIIACDIGLAIFGFLLFKSDGSGI